VRTDDDQMHARPEATALRRLRGGELLALLGVGCVVASLLLPWYGGAPGGRLDAWDTFGAGLVLLILAACAALALVLGALGERSTAVPVSAAVWTVAAGLVGVIAALVRVLERPQHATSLCAGGWLALGGAVAVLAGGWLTLRDEHTSLYDPVAPPPRPRP
jgi:hypothetical protein